MAGSQPPRREPTLDDGSTASAAAPAASERQTPRFEPPGTVADPVLASAGAPGAPSFSAWHQDEPEAPRRGGWGRALALCVMFAFGAACGAAALWLHDHPQGWKPILASWQQRIQQQVADAGPAASAPEPTISAGELPYDGRTPAAPAAAASVAPPNAAVAITTPDATQSAATAAAAPKASTTAAPARVAAAPPAPAAVKKPAADAGPSKVAESDTAPARRNRTTPTLARNDAAADAARRDGGRERTLTPLMIAQCESMSSSDQRAQCKREVCYGKWGQYGCPSYSGAMVQ